MKTALAVGAAVAGYVLARRNVRVTKMTRRSIYSPFCLYYATKGGGPVLKGQSHWWQVNGFLFQRGQTAYSVVFRRHVEGTK